MKLKLIEPGQFVSHGLDPSPYFRSGRMYVSLGEEETIVASVAQLQCVRILNVRMSFGIVISATSGAI